MKLLGFNFTKINVERLSDEFKELKIDTNINILNINQLENEFFKTNEDVIKVDFDYNILYEPKFAKLNFSGNFLISLDSKMSKEVLKKWKEKDLSNEFRISLINLIMKKVSIKALELEEEMGIPLHFPLPTLKNSESKNEN